jgi:hypothetical protein
MDQKTRSPPNATTKTLNYGAGTNESFNCR